MGQLQRKQKEKPTAQTLTRSCAARDAYLLSIFLLLQSILIFWASGNWARLGEGIQQALQSQVAQQQWVEDASGTSLPRDLEKNTERSETPYLAQLIRRVDIWFLSLKGISSALAIVESSTVELGVLVYGSVSIGKAVSPLRNLLQRPSNILFHGRLVLTAVQAIQSIGHHYGIVLLLALFALAALEYILQLLQAGLRYTLTAANQTILAPAAAGAREYSLLPKLLQPMKFFSFLRFHLLLFLLLSWCFEPSILYLDTLLEQVVLPQELRQSEKVLQELLLDS